MPGRRDGVPVFLYLRTVATAWKVDEIGYLCSSMMYPPCGFIWVVVVPEGEPSGTFLSPSEIFLINCLEIKIKRLPLRQTTTQILYIMETTILTTIIVKDERFETVGITMRTASMSFRWGVSEETPGYYHKVINGKYYEEFVQLYELVSRNATLMNLREYFMEVMTESLGEEVLAGASMDFSELSHGIEILERREKEIISRIR